MDLFPKHQLFYIIGGFYFVVFSAIACLLADPNIGIKNEEQNPHRLIGEEFFVVSGSTHGLRRRAGGGGRFGRGMLVGNYTEEYEICWRCMYREEHFLSHVWWDLEERAVVIIIHMVDRLSD